MSKIEYSELKNMKKITIPGKTVYIYDNCGGGIFTDIQEIQIYQIDPSIKMICIKCGKENIII